MKVDHVVYSDDNIFPHTRNCLTNMIFFMLYAVHTRRGNCKGGSRCVRRAIQIVDTLFFKGDFSKIESRIQSSFNTEHRSLTLAFL